MSAPGRDSGLSLAVLAVILHICCSGALGSKDGLSGEVHGLKDQGHSQDAFQQDFRQALVQRGLRSAIPVLEDHGITAQSIFASLTRENFAEMPLKLGHRASLLQWWETLTSPHESGVRERVTTTAEKTEMRGTDSNVNVASEQLHAMRNVLDYYGEGMSNLRASARENFWPDWVQSEEPKCVPVRPAIDSTWLLNSCFKILMMQTGFAVVESSFVRERNAANIMMKNLCDLCFGALGFWSIGWALAYGVDPNNPHNVNGFCGTGHWFMIQGYDYSMWMFQYSFAATAATIDSGAVAERMNFKPYIIYSFLMTAIYQPIVSHWCWDPNGWLAKMGFHDFAGCGPVHVIGGISALFAAWFIGPRTGRFAKKGVIGVLNIDVVQGENLNSNDRVTHPYVVIQQLNHGDAESRSPSSQNCTNPRWGSMIKFLVYRDLAEEAEIQKDLEMQGMLELRFVQNRSVEEVAEFVY